MSQSTVKFIPHQVVHLRHAQRAVECLQHQKVRIKRYARKLQAFDSCAPADSYYRDTIRRDDLLYRYNRHVSIYMRILDHYTALITAMTDGIIQHIAGSYPHNVAGLQVPVCTARSAGDDMIVNSPYKPSIAHSRTAPARDTVGGPFIPITIPSVCTDGPLLPDPVFPSPASDVQAVHGPAPVAA